MDWSQADQCEECNRQRLSPYVLNPLTKDVPLRIQPTHSIMAVLGSVDDVANGPLIFFSDLHEPTQREQHTNEKRTQQKSVNNTADAFCVAYAVLHSSRAIGPNIPVLLFSGNITCHLSEKLQAEMLGQGSGWSYLDLPLCAPHDGACLGQTRDQPVGV